MTRLASLAVALCIALPAKADEVTDTLQSAIDAYSAGDIQYALEELDYARQKLLEMKTDSLGAFLPQAPDGWTRQVDTEMTAGLAMMGGGVGAAAEYTAPDGASATITLMADNAMVGSMAAMVANAAAMGMKTERINRQQFAAQDGQMLALVGNRVLIQAEGDLSAARMLLQSMDFEAMAGFGA
jgi:hypothetical protein